MRSNMKNQLIMATVESLLLAGGAGFLAGIELHAGSYLLTLALLAAALFNVQNAKERFALYKAQN